MIVLLNEQAVVFEVLNAIRVQASKQLQIPHGWVEIRLERDKHIFSKPTYHPVIEIKLPSATDPAMRPIVEDAIAVGVRAFKLSDEEMKAELDTLMTLARNEINLRLAGLDS